MHERIKQLGFAVVPYACTLIAMCLVNYIDVSVIALIYLPIFLIAVISIMYKKYYAGHIFLVSAEIGLILEYIISLNYEGRPRMSGAFLNTAILLLGLVIGILTQSYVIRKGNRKKKTK